MTSGSKNRSHIKHFNNILKTCTEEIDPIKKLSDSITSYDNKYKAEILQKFSHLKKNPTIKHNNSQIEVDLTSLKLMSDGEEDNFIIDERVSYDLQQPTFHLSSVDNFIKILCTKSECRVKIQHENSRVAY